MGVAAGEFDGYDTGSIVVGAPAVDGAADGATCASHEDHHCQAVAHPWSESGNCCRSWPVSRSQMA